MGLIWTLICVCAGVALGWWLWGRTSLARERRLDELWRNRLVLAEVGKQVAKPHAPAASPPPPRASIPGPSTADFEHMRAQVLKSQSERSAALAEIDRLGAEVARLRKIANGARRPHAPIPADAAERAARTGIPPASGTVAGDLTCIRGVGPKLAILLNTLGVFTFAQVAHWGPDEITRVDDHLEGFKGRIARDGWVRQAKALAHIEP